jgi:rRNA maturation protein Rpf1
MSTAHLNVAMAYGEFLVLQVRALELPKEHEMDPKDKYSVFTRHARGYRKGIHKVPKWTRVRYTFGSRSCQMLTPCDVVFS